MKLDVLAFAAHPDDVELTCSGTLIKLKKQGKRIGIVDLTRGELGTRGTPELRQKESDAASRIMGLDVRENLDLGDGWFEVNKENMLKVIQVIRRYRPDIILLNAIDDRHPDHPRAAQLVKDAAFRSGLSKIHTEDNGKPQERWRPPHQFHYIQYWHIRPQFVVDITDEFETKMEAIKAYGSQFYDPDSPEENTLISSKKFLGYLEARSREMGGVIGCEFGEGFSSDMPLPFELAQLL